MGMLGLYLLTFISACHAISITTGPSDTTQEIGSRFILKCAVSGKTTKDTVFWSLDSKHSPVTIALTYDENSKNPDFYEIETGTYNLIVKNATYEDDGVFKCEAGTNTKTATVQIYDKPDSMTLDWEHSVNKPGAVKPGEQYKLRCISKHSYPLAVHRYYKDGVELSSKGISFTYENGTDSDIGYGDVTSTLPLTPSEEDVGSMRTVRCVVDLYDKKNVSSVAFGINSATHSQTFGAGTVLFMLACALIGS